MAAPLEPWALNVLRLLPALHATSGPDAEAMLEGRAHPILIEAKRRVDAATAHAVVALARQTPVERDFLLVAEHTSVGAREILEANGVAYLDGLGNALIRFPDLFVRTGSFGAASVIADRPPTRARLAGKAGLIAQALLLDRGRSWRVGDAAAEAGVSAGLAHRVLARLEEAAILTAEGSGPKKVRRLANPAALLDLWAEEEKEPGARRTTAYVLTRPGIQLADVLSERLSGAAIDHAVTGVAAAAMLAPALTSVSVNQIRLTARLPASEALRALDARFTEEGSNLVLVQGADDVELRFRRQVAGTWLAANTRIYLDALRDPRRGKEQAQAFRESVLGI